MLVSGSILVRATLLCVLAVGALSGCEKKADPIVQAEKAESKGPGIEATKAILEEAYIYGFPMIANYKAMYEFNIDKASSQFKSGFNQLYNESHVATYKDTAVVTPNSDTPYSILQADLRAEPLVLCVPEVESSRYYAVQLIDMYAQNYGYIGRRTTGSEAGCYAVAGPDWTGETPPGIAKVFRSETQFSLILFRTQLFGPDDIENVKAVQAGYLVSTLSAFLKQPAPAAAAAVDFPKFSDEAFKTEFPAYLDFLLQFAPEVPAEKELRARFASIGIGPGKTFAFADLDLEHKAAAALAIKQGFDKIDVESRAIGTQVNGWHVGSAFGDRAFYAGNWLLRAGAAKAGIFGNDAAEATYPMTRQAADNTPLDASQHDYTITFPAGELPPVNAFWSITMYDGKTQLLIENPLNRYLINSPMLPKMMLGADGSLTIYVQKDSPGADKEANWLPAPNGPIYLVMRLYWPKTEPPSILPPGEGTWKPPAVERVAAP
jgi:hypothetical protein